jgi:hypothetical protein
MIATILHASASGHLNRNTRAQHKRSDRGADAVPGLTRRLPHLLELFADFDQACIDVTQRGTP